MGWETAALAVGGGLLGGLAGSQSSGGGTTTSTTTPWAAQIPFLRRGFREAKRIYNDQKDTPFYEGDLYARMNPTQFGGIDMAANYARGMGNANAANISAAANQGINSLGAFAGNYGDLYNRLGQDPTASNIQAAGMYANNPFLDGAIDAASRDVTRNLTESVLPGINRGASGSGNVNSTRAGVAEGVALRGAQDRIGDIASSVRADAYDKGLSRAESARQFNIGGQLDANQGLGTAAGLGLDYANAGSSLTNTNADNLVKSGTLLQNEQQKLLDQDLARWQANDTRPWDILNRYWGIVGSNNWGQTTTSTAPSVGGGWTGALQGALGGAMMGANIGNNFFSAPSAPAYSMQPNGSGRIWRGGP